MTATAQRREAVWRGEAHTVRHTTQGQSYILADTKTHSLPQTLVVMSLLSSIEHLEDQGIGAVVCLQIQVNGISSKVYAKCMPIAAMLRKQVSRAC
jgi:hypothetical protein